MTKEEIEKAKYYELHKHYELVNLLMEKDKEIERLKNKAKSWEDLHGDVMESLRELTDIAVKTESELTELKEKHKRDVCLIEDCDAIAKTNYRLCPKHLKEAHDRGFDDSNK